MKNSAILLISCPDQKGLNAAVHEFIYRAGGNTLHADEHQDLERNLFLMRVEWDLAGFSIDIRDFAKHFQRCTPEHSVVIDLKEANRNADQRGASAGGPSIFP